MYFDRKKGLLFDIILKYILLIFFSRNSSRIERKRQNDHPCISDVIRVYILFERQKGNKKFIMSFTKKKKKKKSILLLWVYNIRQHPDCSNISNVILMYFNRNFLLYSQRQVQSLFGELNNRIFSLLNFFSAIHIRDYIQKFICLNVLDFRILELLEL